MLKYAKIIDEETKKCKVGVGTDFEYYESIGMEQLDVEQAYNGNWYLAGFCPDKPHNLQIMEQIDALKTLLLDADYWGQKYIDGEYTDTEWEQKKEQRKAWRQQIRDLESQIWPEQEGVNENLENSDLGGN